MEKRSNCPISYCLDFVGDRWTLLILRDVLIAKKKHFKEFATSGEGIASNLLSSRLKMLVDHGFLTSSVDPVRRNMKIYAPTPKAVDVLPVLVEMMVWSSQHGEFGGDHQRLLDFAHQVRTNREAVLAAIAGNKPEKPSDPAKLSGG